MATYSTFRAQLRSELEESTASIWSDASLLAYTNETVEDVANRLKVMTDEQYLTTVSGTESYAMPDYYTIEILWARFDSDNSILERLSAEEYFALDLTSDDAEPTNYALFNDVLYLYPTPNVADTLRLFRSRRPAPIDADDDDMPFASRFDRIIKDGVKARCFEQTQDAELAAFFGGKYERAMAEAEFQVKDNDISNAILVPRKDW